MKLMTNGEELMMEPAEPSYLLINLFVLSKHMVNLS